MLVVVKTPPIRIEGEIPPNVVEYFESKFENVEIVEDGDEETVNFRDTAWFQAMEKNWHPGDTVKTYRENKGWTQKGLAERVGATDRQLISKIERGQRGVSKALALKFSEVFELPVERFLVVQNR